MATKRYKWGIFKTWFVLCVSVGFIFARCFLVRCMFVSFFFFWQVRSTKFFKDGCNITFSRWQCVLCYAIVRVGWFFGGTLPFEMLSVKLYHIDACALCSSVPFNRIFSFLFSLSFHSIKLYSICRTHTLYVCTRCFPYGCEEGYQEYCYEYNTL